MPAPALPPTPPRDAASLAQQAKALALATGFHRAGIAGLEPSPETERAREWVARGHHADMDWIERRIEERVDPRKVLPCARSALVVGFVYDRDASAPVDDPSASRARVARYAGGEDYHDVLLDQLRSVGDGLEALAGRPVRSRSYIDTGPLLERVLAQRAGLGWIGRNTCLIDPELGSYLFLGVLLTDLALPPDTPIADHCGSCTACLDACPTDAFPEPYVLDSRRCLSYTTIELRDAIPEDLREGQGDWLFGCDICQDVCPWNTRTRRGVPPDPHGLGARMAPRPEWLRPTLAWLLDLDEEAWRAATRRTAMRRTRYRRLLRNAIVAAGNSGDTALLPALERHAAGADGLLAEHADWALARLRAGPTARGAGSIG